MTPPGSARRPGRGPEAPWGPPEGVPGPPWGPKMCYLAPGPRVSPRSQIIGPVACHALSPVPGDKHILATSVRLWNSQSTSVRPIGRGTPLGYPQMCLRLRRHRLPAQMFLLGPPKADIPTKTTNGKTSSPFFLGFRPLLVPRCPYRPLISYKIGQMPTVTRGG